MARFANSYACLTNSLNWWVNLTDLKQANKFCNLLPRNRNLHGLGSGRDNPDTNHNTNSSESSEDFERRTFGRLSDDGSSSFRRIENHNGSLNSDSSYIFRSLDKIENRIGADMYPNFRRGNKTNILEGGDESFSSLTDGLEKRLKNAATYFEVNENEIDQDDYTFRPDMNVRNGMTYTPEDLNLRKPAVWRPSKRAEFEVTTEEVLKKADFRFGLMDEHNIKGAAQVKLLNLAPFLPPSQISYVPTEHLNRRHLSTPSFLSPTPNNSEEERPFDTRSPTWLS